MKQKNKERQKLERKKENESQKLRFWVGLYLQRKKRIGYMSLN